MFSVPVARPPQIPPPIPPPHSRPLRTALVVSADSSFRQRLAQILSGLRWQVRDAEGGAQAWDEAQCSPPEALIVDTWLPDLDLNEFLADFRRTFPQVDLVAAGGASTRESPRGPYRQELLYALRRCQDTDTAAWNSAPSLNKTNSPADDATHISPWSIPPVEIRAAAATSALPRAENIAALLPPGVSAATADSGQPERRLKPMPFPQIGCRN